MYKGIDISAHQGDINIEALASQVDFFIFRGNHGYTIDGKANRNIDECIRVGKPYGLYCYSYSLSTSEAIQEANILVGLANSKSQRPSFICIDMEDADGYKQKNGLTNNEILISICESFCQVVEAAGYYANIYANLNWFNTKLNSPRLDKYDKWVAQWSSRCDYPKPYHIWQYSSTGRLSGYNGNLDMNYAYHDFVLEKKTNGGAAIVSPIVPQAPAVPTGTYTVVSGDSLSAIGQKLGVAWQEISRLNNIQSPYVIYVGQILTVPEVTNTYTSTSVDEIKVGDNVKVKEGAKDWTGVSLASFVYSTVYDVIQINGNRIVIGIGGQVTCAIDVSNIYKA